MKPSFWLGCLMFAGLRNTWPTRTHKIVSASRKYSYSVFLLRIRKDCSFGNAKGSLGWRMQLGWSLMTLAIYPADRSPAVKSSLLGGGDFLPIEVTDKSSSWLLEWEGFGLAAFRGWVGGVKYILYCICSYSIPLLLIVTCEKEPWYICTYY